MDQAAVQRALNAAIPAFFAARLTEVASDFRRLVEAMLARHQVRADALVGSVRQTAAALFDVPLQAVEATEAFRLGPEPYWVTQQWRDAVMPSPDTLVMWLLPSRLRQKALRRQLEAEIGALVQHNVENLRWATLRGVNETFRRFSAQLDSRLAEVLRVTHGVNHASDRTPTIRGWADNDRTATGARIRRDTVATSDGPSGTDGDIRSVTCWIGQ